MLTSPFRILYDASILRGHPVLLVSENGNGVIWLLDLNSREVELFAGQPGGGRYTNGPASQASFSGPSAMALASDGTLYVADRGNHAIRSIANDANRTVDTYAGNLPDGRTRTVAANQRYSYPSGLAFGPDGSLYISDERNHRIRRIRKLSGFNLDEAVAGDALNNTSGYVNGAPSDARFFEPSGMTFVGNQLYLADIKNNRIRKISFQ